MWKRGGWKRGGAGVGLALAMLAGAVCAVAQQAGEVGAPLIKTYPLKTFAGATQTWALLRDARGLLYVGSGSQDIHQYDGVVWRDISGPGTSTRSLAMDAKGTIWVGTSAGFGYLVPEANGTLRYVSLLDKILPEDRNLSAVYVKPTAQGVFFRSQTRLFLWDGRKLQVWRPKQGFQGLSEVHGRIYMSELGVGLQEFAGGRWNPAPGGEALSEAVKVTMHPWDETHSLITSRGGQLWLYDGRSLQPFHTEADAYLKSNEAYSSIQLADGGFCITTMLGGAVILEHDGRLRRILDKNSGLPDPGVYEAFEDSEGALWLGQGASLSRVELKTSITEVTRHTSSTLVRFQGGLYLGSGSGGAGLHRLVPETSTGVPTIKTLAAPVSQGFELMVFRDPAGRRDQLLGATGNGLVRIEGDKVMPLMPGGYSAINSAYTVMQSTKVPNRVYCAVGNSGALLAYRWDGAKWAEEAGQTLIPGIRSLLEEEDGSLWAGGQGGVVRIDKAGDNFRGAKTEIFGEKNGLPGGGSYAVKRVGGQIIATPGNYAGMFRWDGTAHKLVPDDRFFLRADSSSGGNVWEQPNGDVWSSTGTGRIRRVGVFHRGGDGRYTLDEASVRGLSAFEVTKIVTAEDGSVLVIGSDGVIRYDPRARGRKEPPFRAMVRLVRPFSGKALFGGDRASAGTGLEVPWGQNSLNFEVAAPLLGNEEQTVYQYLLEGAEKNWTDWGKLRPGRVTGVWGRVRTGSG